MISFVIVLECSTRSMLIRWEVDQERKPFHFACFYTISSKTAGIQYWKNCDWLSSSFSRRRLHYCCHDFTMSSKKIENDREKTWYSQPKCHKRWHQTHKRQHRDKHSGSTKITKLTSQDLPIQVFFLLLKKRKSVSIWCCVRTCVVTREAPLWSVYKGMERDQVIDPC